MACRCAPWNGEYGKFYKTCGSDRTVGRGQTSQQFMGLIEEDYASKTWKATGSMWMRPADQGRPPTRKTDLGVHATKAAARARVETWLKAACEGAHGPGFSGRRCR